MNTACGRCAQTTRLDGPERTPDWVLRTLFARLPGGRVTGEARSLVADAWNIPWNILADSFVYIQRLILQSSGKERALGRVRPPDRREGEHLIPLKRVPEALRCCDRRDLSRAAAGAAARHCAACFRRTSTTTPGEREECAGGADPARTVRPHASAELRRHPRCRDRPTAGRLARGRAAAG